MKQIDWIKIFEIHNGLLEALERRYWLKLCTVFLTRTEKDFEYDGWIKLFNATTVFKTFSGDYKDKFFVFFFQCEYWI